MKNFLIAAILAFNTAASFAADTISPQENVACRKDAIRNCFFSLGSAESTRACLRKNLAVLSPKCKALVEARMKAN
jgi:hypothetical protein